MMIRDGATRLSRLGRVLFAVGVGLGGATAATAQHAPARPAQRAASSPHAAAAGGSTVPALLLSDLHFDPFTDPAKFERLRSTGAEGWSAIFASPASPTAVQDFAKLNSACHFARGMDTAWPLLESSLAEAKAAAPHALFAVVSGDLMAHEFDCRFKVLAPKATEADFSAFAFKAIAYVALELRRTFGTTPVYVALGNNDSGCGDYRETPGSVFLRALAQSLAGTLNSPGDRAALAARFPESGGYSVALPAPIARGRLIVMQDLFMARTYKNCEGKQDPGNADAQLQWLRTELMQARAAGEQVWVVAHIPPGVDVYSTTTRRVDVCGGQSPVMFLANEKLAEALTDFSDVVRLAIFAHTHLDEMRLLRSADGQHVVAAKLVPSISPVNGNLPAFLVADVDTATATIRDYRAMEASNGTGVGAQWSEEYRFSKLYHLPAFTPAALEPLLAGFAADRSGIAQASTDYQQNVFAGGGKGSLAVHFLWANYVCSMTNNTAEGYRACACAKAP